MDESAPEPAPHAPDGPDAEPSAPAEEGEAREVLSAALEDRRANLLIGLGSVLAGILAFFFVKLELLLAALKSLSPTYVILAAAFAALSFVVGGLGLRWLIRRPWVRGRLDGRHPIHITVLSQLASNLLSFGGLTGATMRARLLAGPERRWSEGLVVAVLFTLALNATSLAITVTAGALLLIPGVEAGSGLALAIALTLPLLATLGFAALVVAHGATLTRAIHKLSDRLGQRLGLGSSLAESHALLEEALGDWRGLVGASLWGLLDWALVSFTLACAFAAVGAPLSYDGLIAVFGIGGLATLLSFVPGGIGVLEASVAGVATQTYGVPLEQALVAVVLYRAIYYGAPLALSPFRFW